MKTKKCPWWKKCSNGGDGCWTLEPEKCVRFMPLEGTNRTKIYAIVETPPEIDDDAFGQYFMNWIESMGWSFIGTINAYTEENGDEREE